MPVIWTLRIVFITFNETWNPTVAMQFFNNFWPGCSLGIIMADRSRRRSEVDVSEDTMGFGQIVPLLLLSSTIFVFWEAYDSTLK